MAVVCDSVGCDCRLRAGFRMRNLPFNRAFVRFLFCLIAVNSALARFPVVLSCWSVCVFLAGFAGVAGFVFVFVSALRLFP